METQNSKPVMLVVLAHPDDETFGMGGTLALYTRRGVEVNLICATRGEVGEVSPERLEGYPSIGALRENELRCAAGLLGLEGVYFLDYRDSGMPGSPDNHHPQALAAAPLDEVAAKVTHYIRKLRPHVVLTFDPIGGYRHPDHIAIQRATVAAFHAAGDVQQYPDPEGLPAFTPQRLYFSTMPRGYLRAAVRVLPLFGRDPHKFGQNGDIDLVSIAEVSFPTHVRVNYRPVARIREAASACHASQGGASMTQGVIGWFQRLFGGSETFMQAFPEPPPQQVKRDLFAGVSV